MCALKSTHIFLYVIRKLLLAALVTSKTTPDESSDNCTDEWTYDEYPKLLKSLTTLEESWADRTSWVNRSTCVVNTYEVDEDE